jgi:hypothetical protein
MTSQATRALAAEEHSHWIRGPAQWSRKAAVCELRLSALRRHRRFDGLAEDGPCRELHEVAICPTAWRLLPCLRGHGPHGPHGPQLRPMGSQTKKA